MSKPKDEITVAVERTTRKKNPPSTAFKPGNEHRFEPGGPSPNPGGKAGKRPKVLSRAIRARLDARAPDQVCEALRLPKRSSWAQIVAASLVNQATRGDSAAMRTLLEYTEGPPPQRLELSSVDEDGEPLTGPALQVVFVDSEFDKLQRDGKTLDALSPAPPSALPAPEREIAPDDPALQAARAEARLLAARKAAELAALPQPQPEQEPEAPPEPDSEEQPAPAPHPAPWQLGDEIQHPWQFGRTERALRHSGGDKPARIKLLRERLDEWKKVHP